MKMTRVLGWFVAFSLLAVSSAQSAAETLETRVTNLERLWRNEFLRQTGRDLSALLEQLEGGEGATTLLGKTIERFGESTIRSDEFFAIEQRQRAVQAVFEELSLLESGL